MIERKIMSCDAYARTSSCSSEPLLKNLAISATFSALGAPWDGFPPLPPIGAGFLLVFRAEVMAIEVVAELGGSVEQGVVARWYCRVGDRVRKGERLGEIETDKADVELAAPEDGIVEAIYVPESATFSAGAPLLRFVPRDIGAAPSDLAQRVHSPKVPVAASTVSERRCRFCHALQISGRHDCPRCGAPL